MSETYIEYAVEVQGRGYANWNGSIDAEPEYWLRGLDDANRLARDFQGQFMRLRCDDIMVSIRVVSRTVTIERSTPQPLVPAAV
jgi:hypothetical protein